MDSLAATGCTLLPTQHPQQTTLTTQQGSRRRGGHDTQCQLDFLITRTHNLARHSDCQNTGTNLGTESPHSTVCTELQAASSIKPNPRRRRTLKPGPLDLKCIKTDSTIRESENACTRQLMRQRTLSATQTKNASNNNGISVRCTLRLPKWFPRCHERSRLPFSQLVRYLLSSRADGGPALLLFAGHEIIEGITAASELPLNRCGERRLDTNRVRAHQTDPSKFSVLLFKARP